jgi:ribosomal protein S18
MLDVYNKRNNVIKQGKFINKTYEYFYNNSTDYNKQYYLDILDPDKRIQDLQEYITNRKRIRFAGYTGLPFKNLST